MSKGKSKTEVVPQEVNVEKVIEDAVSDWAVQNNPAAIREKIHSMLDRHLTSIIAQTMGFKQDRWAGRDGGWEVDHCNGVQKYTAIGQMITNNANDVIQDWVRDLNVTVEDIPDGLNKAYKKAIFEELQRNLRRQAQETASNLIDEYTKGVAESIDLSAVKVMVPAKADGGYRSAYDPLDWDVDEDWEDDEDDEDDDEDDIDISDPSSWRI